MAPPQSEKYPQLELTVVITRAQERDEQSNNYFRKSVGGPNCLKQDTALSQLALISIDDSLKLVCTYSRQ